MPTIVAILSCVLIGQYSTDQPQAGAAVEQVGQSTSAGDLQPAGEILAPAEQPANSQADQAPQSEIPEAAAPQKSEPVWNNRTSTLTDSALTDQPVSMRMRPPQLVAEAITLPQGSAVAGQPIQLVQALSASTDRRQQLAITHAYWQMVEAVGKYHFCLMQVERLGRLQAHPNEEVSLRAARSAAAAMLREEELSAGSVQFELASLLQLPADARLPLPADRPHVGAYRTNFQTLFAAQRAPDRARVIDRTLPIRRMAIDQRAIAVQAAQDALEAAIDAYQAGQGGLAGVISNSNQLTRQQQAFIETVCRYNHDIAEYASIVAAPGTTPQVLVGFMITPAREAGRSTIAEGGEGVRAAGWSEPPSFSATVKEPASAPARGLAPVGTKNEPTLAPPRSESPGNEGRWERTPQSKESKPDEGKGELEPLETEEPAKTPNNSVDPFMRQTETVNKPVADIAENSPALYPALVDAAPSVRAKQLSLALHWDRSLPNEAGKAMTLEECLSRKAGNIVQAGYQAEIGRGAQNERTAAVAAFWIARQRAAEYQAVAQEIEFLDNLAPVVLQQRAKSDGAAAMLFLRTARLSAKANLQESHAALIEAQFELALRTQSAGESLWPLPSTPPHAGQYQLNLEAQPRALVQSWPMRRLTAAIPGYSTSLQEHAASVVSADTARAKSVEKYAAGEMGIEQVLEDVGRQTRQTFDFLQTLTEYNNSIAQYALTVLPPDAPPTRIASALVVQK